MPSILPRARACGLSSSFTTKPVRPSCSQLLIRHPSHSKTVFHCTVATSFVVFEAVSLKGADAIEAMGHANRAFHLLNKKISSEDALSDTTMANMICMAQYERVQSQYGQALVHFKGLQRMVELRGGIELLKSKRELAQKIFRSDR
jgi:Fungal specific transcription factor domain